MICLDLDFNLTKNIKKYSYIFFFQWVLSILSLNSIFLNMVKALRDVCSIVDGFKAYILKRNET